MAANGGAEGEWDPFQTEDPWAQNAPPTFGGGTEAQQPVPEAPTYAQTTDTAREPQRIVHDVPPTWDGKDPDEQAEPFLKLLEGWLSTTRTQRTQRGMVILQYAQGDLKLIVNELDIAVLTSETSGEKCLAHIRESYSEYLDKQLPKALERALYAKDARRAGQESMIQYVARKRTLFKEIERAGCKLPTNALGYIMQRDAGLSDKAWDTLETWNKASYELAEVATSLRKLERPVPGKGGHGTITGMTGYEGVTGYVGQGSGEMANPSASSSGFTSILVNTDSGQEALEFEFMTESLFVLPESFVGELLEEAIKDSQNPEVLYVAGDMADTVVLEEDEAVAILANYGQVRNYLHKKQLSRGYFRQQAPKGKGKGKGIPPPPPPGGQRPFTGSNARPKRWSKGFLMSRSKCARCGKLGHWARECKNPPDERGRQRAGMTGFMMVTPSDAYKSSDATSTTAILACGCDETQPDDDDADNDDDDVYAISWVFPEGEPTETDSSMTSFIGLNVNPGQALVDTGAQHGVIGPQGFQNLCAALQEHGLKPRHIETLKMKATGVGGSSEFTFSAEVPIAIKGVSGLVTLHGVPIEIPCLLPVELLDSLGMILNLPDNKIHWKHIGVDSEVYRIGAAPHLAVNICEYPREGWQNPYEARSSNIVGTKPKSIVPRSEFETSAQGSRGHPAWVKQSPVYHNTGDAGSASGSRAQYFDLEEADREYELREGRGGSVVRVTAGGTMEEVVPSVVLDLQGDGHQDDGERGPRPGCVPEGVPASTEPGSDTPGAWTPHHQRGDRGSATLERHGGGDTRPGDVPASSGQDEAQGQQVRQVVDVYPVSVTVDTDRASGAGTRTTTGHGPDGIREARDEDLQGRVRDSGELRAVGAHDRGDWREPERRDEEVRQVRGCEGSTGSQLAEAPEARRGGGGPEAVPRGPGVPGVHVGAGVPDVGRRRAVNSIITGKALVLLLGLPLLIGYVGQVVSAETKYRSLEGPVFGTRVGIVQQESQQVILYRCPEGAAESSWDDDDLIATVPAAVSKAIKRKLDPRPDKRPETVCLPLEAIPEEVEPPEAKQELPEERLDEDPNAEPEDSDDEEYDPNPPAWTPTAQELRDLKIAHDNSGHPSNADFARLIRRGNGKPEIAAWVRKNFSCEECLAERRPKARRPSAIPKTYRFNHVVGIDLVDVKNLVGDKEKWINCVCWGTGFQLVGRVPGGGKEAKDVWNAFVHTWVRVMGVPEIVVCDPGLEFQGYFAEKLAESGTAQLLTDPRAPWQNGRTERAGMEWKKQVKLAKRKEMPLDDSEHVALCEYCCQMRNRYSNRSGFSPMQRVFGAAQRLPNSLLSDDPIDPSYLSEDPSVEFERSEKLRQAALRAWAALDNRARLLKAFRGRHRVQETFQEGQTVFVWRQPKLGPGKWYGPGVVVLPTAGGCWINLRGALWRCNNEQLRSATSEECRGAELINQYLSGMKADLRKNRGARKYVDVRREGVPRFPGEPQIEEDDDQEDFQDSDDQVLGEDQVEPEVEVSVAGSEDPIPRPGGYSRPASDAEDQGRNVRPRLDTGEQEPEQAPSVASSSSGRAPPPGPGPGNLPRAAGPGPGNPPRASGSAPSTPVFPFGLGAGGLCNFYIQTDSAGPQDGFTAEEAQAQVGEASACFYIRKRAEDAEIDISKLPDKARKLFTDPGGSDEKEWKAIQAPDQNGEVAIRVHRGAEAAKLRARYPNRLIPSRWHRKWKDMGDDYDNKLNLSEVPKHHGAKSRWIIIGFHDPDIAILNRTVATPETGDVPLALQMLASIQAQAWVGDVKSAFSQGLKGLRPEPLFATAPKGGIIGEKDDILIEIVAEIYGLITGPPAWRKSLLTTFKQLGFKRHPLAPCVVVFYETHNGVDETLTGLVVIETDDLLGGGIGEAFFEAVKTLKETYKFGKWVWLQENSTEYGGRTLKQLEDYGFTISMVRYLKERAREIRIEKGRRSKPEALATEEEITAMRGLTGKLNWATREGMPQGCGDASLLSSTMPTPKVKDLIEANAALRRLLQADASIRIWSIPLLDLRVLLFGDSSLANSTGGTCQLAYMVCAADKEVFLGRETCVSILTYKSHRMNRAGSSTLLVESNAMSEGLAHAEWVTTWIGLCKDLRYDMRKRDLLNREIKINAIISGDSPDLNMAAITDAKSLFDNLSREQFTGAERRAALEICVIRDSLESLGGAAKWVPHEENPVDCLTKLKGNAARMVQLMKTARFQLTNVEAEMTKRKEYREQTGKRNPRPMRTTEHGTSTSSTFFVSTPLGSSVGLTSCFVVNQGSAPVSTMAASSSGGGAGSAEDAPGNLPRALGEYRRRVPDEPQGDIGPVPAALGQTHAQRAYELQMLDRLQSELDQYNRTIALMSTADPLLLEAYDLRGEFQAAGALEVTEELRAYLTKPNKQARLDRLHELRGQVERCETQLRELRSRSQVPEQIDQVAASDGKIPAAVYDVFMYLEARRIQRARVQQHRSGLFHPATARSWRMYLYKMVRRRIHIYRKQKAAQEEKRRTARERGEQEPPDETSVDVDEAWLQRAARGEGDQLEELDRPATGRLLEPGKYKRKGGAEYKRRKRQAKKARKKAAKAGAGAPVESAAEATAVDVPDTESRAGDVDMETSAAETTTAPAPVTAAGEAEARTEETTASAAAEGETTAAAPPNLPRASAEEEPAGEEALQPKKEETKSEATDDEEEGGRGYGVAALKREPRDDEVDRQDCAYSSEDFLSSGEEGDLEPEEAPTSTRQPERRGEPSSVEGPDTESRAGAVGEGGLTPSLGPASASSGSGLRPGLEPEVEDFVEQESFQRVYEDIQRRVVTSQRHLPPLNQEPGPEPLTLEEEFRSYVQHSMSHWSRATLITNANANSIYHELHREDVMSAPSVLELQVVLMHMGLKNPRIEESPLQWKGPPEAKWWTIDVGLNMLSTMLRRQHGNAVLLRDGDISRLEITYHGTSIKNVSRILREGQLRPAANTIMAADGVYCEGSHRRDCTLCYAIWSTLGWECWVSPYMLWTVVFECAIDPTYRRIRRQQYVVPRERIMVICMHVGCVHISNCFNRHSRGWNKVENESLEKLMSRNFEPDLRRRVNHNHRYFDMYMSRCGPTVRDQLHAAWRTRSTAYTITRVLEEEAELEHGSDRDDSPGH